MRCDETSTKSDVLCGPTAQRLLVRELSAQICTLPAARSDTHGTLRRFTDRNTVLCRGIRASLSTAHAYRQLQTDSMRKNNIARDMQTSRRQFFVSFRPFCRTSLSSQHEFLATRVSSAQGKFRGGRGRSRMQ